MASLGDLFVKVGADISGFSQAMGRVKTDVTGMGGLFQKFGTTASLGLGAIGAGAFAASQKFNDAFVKIGNATGATGEKLDGLTKSFTNVYKQVDESSEQVAEALSLIATRTGLTGKALEGMTVKLLDLAKVQNESIASLTPEITRAFGDWSIATDKQSSALDFLGVVSQQTGTKVTRLTGLVVQFGAPLRELGYTFEEASTLIAKFDKEGVNVETVLAGMKKALSAFAAAGKDPAVEWQKFVAGVQSGAVSLQDTMKLVGVRLGTDVFKAIQEGRFEIDKTVNSYKELSKEGVKTTDTLMEQWTKYGHQIEAAIAEHSSLITTIGLTIPALKTVGEVAVKVFGASSAGLVGLATAAIIAIGLAAKKLQDYELIKQNKESQFMKDINKKYGPGSSKSIMDAAIGFTEVQPFMEGAGPAKTPAAGAFELPSKGKDKKKHPIEDAFAQLGMTDVRKELAETEKAFETLLKAGKLSAAQIVEVEEKIDLLRKQIIRLDQGLPAVAEKIQRIPFAEKSQSGALLTAQIQLLTERHRAMTKEIAESGLTVDAFFIKKMKEAEESLIRFNKLDPPAANWKAPIEDASNALDKIMGIFAGSDIGGEFKKIDAAASALGVSLEKTNIPQLTAQYNVLKDAFDRNAISINVLEAAYINLIKAKAAAGVATEAEIAAAKRLEEAQKAGMKNTRTEAEELARDLEQMARRTFGNLERDIAQNIIAWKGWSESIKNIGRGFATDFLQIMLKVLLKPLEDAFAKVVVSIGSHLGTLLGVGGGAAVGVAKGVAGAAATTAASVAGTAATTAASVGTTVAKTGGQVAGMGVSAITGMVTGAISAVSGVIGNFQMKGMNKSLDVIVNHTLRTFNEVEQQRKDHWSQHNQMYERVGEIWNTLKLGAPGSPAGGGNVTIDLRNSTFHSGVTKATMQEAFQQMYREAVAAVR